MRKKILCLLLALPLGLSLFHVPASAAGNGEDERVIVSLGDSYSSGEGIEPFFGQDEDMAARVKNEDWLAHRSELSWPALLKVQLDNGAALERETVTSAKSLKDIPGGSEVYDKKGKTWFFAAVSGAKTRNLKHLQHKDYKKSEYIEDSDDLPPQLDVFTDNNLEDLQHKYYKKSEDIEGSENLPPQLDVFADNNLKGKVDYVTVTIGGNDVDFAGIIEDCAITPDVLCPNHLNNKLNAVWAKFYGLSVDTNEQGEVTLKLDVDTNGKGEVSLGGTSGVKEKLRKAYKDIAREAGEQATILVAGYPQLLDISTHYILGDRFISFARIVNKAKVGILVFTEDEAEKLRTAVAQFNKEIDGIIEECRNEGMKIEFVPVQDAFETHAAYSSDPYINPVMPYQTQDLKWGLTSAYSIHPNESGAWAYAKCVYEKIMELEGKVPSTDTQTDTEAETSVLSQEEIEAGKQALIQKVYEVYDIYAANDYEPYIGAYVYDIDKDGVPEIFIRGTTGDDSYSYAYRDNEVKELPCGTDVCGGMYVYKDFIIFYNAGLSVGDGFFIDVWKYSNKKMKRKASYWVSNEVDLKDKPVAYDYSGAEYDYDVENMKTISWKDLQNNLSKYQLKLDYDIEEFDEGKWAIPFLKTTGKKVKVMNYIETLDGIVDAINRNGE